MSSTNKNKQFFKKRKSNIVDESVIKQKTIDIETQLRLQREKSKDNASKLDESSQHVPLIGFYFDSERQKYFRIGDKSISSNITSQKAKAKIESTNYKTTNERLSLIHSLNQREIIRNKVLTSQLIFHSATLERSVMEHNNDIFPNSRNKDSSFHPRFGLVLSRESHLQFCHQSMDFTTEVISNPNYEFSKVKWLYVDCGEALIGAVMSCGNPFNPSPDILMILRRNNVTTNYDKSFITIPTSLPVHGSGKQNKEIHSFTFMNDINTKIITGNSTCALLFDCNSDLRKAHVVAASTSPVVALCPSRSTHSIILGLRNGNVCLTDIRQKCNNIENINICKSQYCVDHMWCLSDDASLVIQDISGNVSMHDIRYCKPPSGTGHHHDSNVLMNIISNNSTKSGFIQQTLISNQRFWVTPDESAILVVPRNNKQDRIPNVSVEAWSLQSPKTKLVDIHIPTSVTYSISNTIQSRQFITSNFHESLNTSGYAYDHDQSDYWFGASLISSFDPCHFIVKSVF
jgi:hypothetical protein